MLMLQLLLAAGFGPGPAPSPPPPNVNATVKWKHFMGGDIDGSPALSGSTLYLAAYDHHLYSFQKETGEVNWKFTANEEYWIIDRSSPVLSADGAVVYCASMVGGGDGNLWAINATTGTKIWNVSTSTEGGDLLTPPAVSRDGAVLYTADQSGFVYAINAVNGSIQWRARPSSGNVDYSPAISPDGEHAYIGSDDGTLYALNATNGAQLWSFATGNAIASAPVVNPNGLMVYVASNDGYMHAVSSSTGMLRWQYLPPYSPGPPLPPTAVFTQPVLNQNGTTLYVGNGDGLDSTGSLFAINALNGTVLWVSPSVPSLTATPCLSPLGHELYVGSDSEAVDYMIGVSVKDGTLLWQWQIPTLPTEVVGGAVSDKEGTVYFGTAAGDLYAITPTPAPPSLYQCQTSACVPASTGVTLDTCNAICKRETTGLNQSSSGLFV